MTDDDDKHTYHSASAREQAWDTQCCCIRVHSDILQSTQTDQSTPPRLQHHMIIITVKKHAILYSALPIQGLANYHLWCGTSLAFLTQQALKLHQMVESPLLLSVSYINKTGRITVRSLVFLSVIYATGCVIGRAWGPCIKPATADPRRSLVGTLA